jgi:hypothetical protein
MAFDVEVWVLGECGIRAIIVDTVRMREATVKFSDINDFYPRNVLKRGYITLYVHSRVIETGLPYGEEKRSRKTGY